MSLIKHEDCKDSIWNKNVNCCLCKGYTGYKTSIFSFSSSFSLVCRIGFGCRKLCDCDMSLVSKEVSISTIQQDFYNCNRCQKIAFIRNKI